MGIIFSFLFFFVPAQRHSKRAGDGWIRGKKADLFDDVTESSPDPPPTPLLSRRASLTAHTPKWSLKAGTVLTSQSPALFRLRVEPWSSHTDEGWGFFSSSLPLNWYSKYSETFFFQHRGRLITLTSDPLCFSAHWEVRRLCLSSPSTSLFFFFLYFF